MMWTDNPERDAERHEAELEEVNRQCLHCAMCGGTIYDGDDYFDLDDMILCEDCMIDNYRRVASYD